MSDNPSHPERSKPWQWRHLTLVGTKNKPLAKGSISSDGQTLLVIPPNDGYWKERAQEVRAGKNEPEIVYAMHHFLDKNTIFVDGGANIGEWSVFAGAKIKKPGQIIAVEASDATLKQLEQNRMLNRDSFSIINKALWNTSGDKVTFYEMANNPVLSTTQPRPGQVPSEKKSVETITVDDIVESAFHANPHARKVVVKLDVQDAEIRVLAGAARTLTEREALIIYEDPRSSPHSETTASLLKQGLHIYYVSPDGHARAIHNVDELTRIKVPPRNGYNFFACRPESAFDHSLQALCQQSAKVKAVLLDWDMTLANTEDVNLACLNATFKAMQVLGHKPFKTGQISKEEMHRTFVGTVPSFFEGVYAEEGKGAAQQAIALFREFRQTKRAETHLMPGAKELVRFLQKKGVKVGIVSNKDTTELHALKTLLLPENEFPGIVTIGYEEGMKAKPSPEPLYRAMQALGMRADQASSVLCAGDRMQTDIVAALAAGCQPCLVGENHQKELASYSARHTGRRNGHISTYYDAEGHKVLYAKDLTALKAHLNATLGKNTGALTL